MLFKRGEFENVSFQGWFSLAHKHKRKLTHARTVTCWSLAPFAEHFPNKTNYQILLCLRLLAYTYA